MRVGERNEERVGLEIVKYIASIHVHSSFIIKLEELQMFHLISLTLTGNNGTYSAVAWRGLRRRWISTI